MKGRKQTPNNKRMPKIPTKASALRPTKEVPVMAWIEDPANWCSAGAPNRRIETLDASRR
jgi:hypothetical protein